jgi:hypothetical protein
VKVYKDEWNAEHLAALFRKITPDLIDWPQTVARSPRARRLFKKIFVETMMLVITMAFSNETMLTYT